MGRRYRDVEPKLRRALATGEARDRCHGKRRFRSRSAAEKFLHGARLLFPGVGLRPYICRTCGGWHTSTASEREDEEDVS